MTADRSVQHGEDTQQTFTLREQVNPNGAHRAARSSHHGYQGFVFSFNLSPLRFAQCAGQTMAFPGS